jgi:hypothetical protein
MNPMLINVSPLPNSAAGSRRRRRVRTRGRSSATLPRGSQLSLGPPTTIPILAVTATITDAARPSRVRLHHASQRRGPRRHAETLKARSELLTSLFDDCRRKPPAGVVDFGIALLRGFSTPSPPAQVGNVYLIFSNSTGTATVPVVWTASGRNKLKGPGSRLLVSPFPEIKFILSCCGVL